MLTTCLPSLAKTDYPSFDVVIVDNGGRSPDNEAWYGTASAGLDMTVRWWDEPFNYSAVNNRAAAEARGDVLVFLNDDTELVDPGWMRELVGGSANRASAWPACSWSIPTTSSSTAAWWWA